MIISIPKETIPGERRVALVPELVPRLTQSGMDVSVQQGAGAAAGFPDSAYLEKGAHLEAEVLSTADVLLKVQPPSLQEAARLKQGTLIIGLLPRFMACPFWRWSGPSPSLFSNAASVRALPVWTMIFYYNPKCMMLFGDAKDSLIKLFAALKS